MALQADLIARLIELARREHCVCEDPWYSCPRSPEGSANPNAGPECDCGAEDHNRLVDQIAAELAQAPPVEDSPAEPPIGGVPDERFWKLPDLPRGR